MDGTSVFMGRAFRLQLHKNNHQPIEDSMKNIKKMLVAAGCAAALCLSSGNVMAQRGGGGGNFDPAQMRQNRLDRIREQIDVKDDSEWKVLETSIGKVMDAQQEAMQGRFGGMGGGRGNRQRGGAAGGAGGTATTAADPAAAGQGGNQARRGGPTPSPEMEDLQKAIEAKAPADEIKAKLQKVRDVSKAKEAKLETAREDLKKLVTARQEAILVVNGILQ
jgi:hypothetical protein